MIPVLIIPHLRQACPSCFPGDFPAVEPHSTVSTGATLRADYRHEACGTAWVRWWDAASAGWPAPHGRAA